MICPKCGAAIDDAAQNCPICGVEVVKSEYVEQQPVLVAEHPMKWFKFLIYFSLFASAVLNGINAIGFLTGSMYGEEATLVYEVFDGLKALDTSVGIAMLGVAVLAIYTRFRLAKYCSNGPAMVGVTYIAVASINVLYIIGAYMVLPAEVMQQIDISSTITSVCVAIAMVFVNRVYFKKRSHLFIN